METENDYNVTQLTMQKFIDTDYNEIQQFIDSLPQKCYSSSNDKKIQLERSLESFVRVLDLYQEKPQLLDSKLSALMEPLLGFVRGADRLLSMQASKYLKHIMKVRGRKTFLRHLPHETVDLTPTLNLLAEYSRIKDEDASDACYVLLVWMSVLCKIPFDLSRFDDAGCDGDSSTKSRIFQTVRPHLAAKDKCQEAAAYCLAVFTNRPDCSAQYVPYLIFDEVLGVLKDYHDLGRPLNLGEQCDVAGRCRLLANLLKQVRRDCFDHEWSRQILDRMFAYDTILAGSTNSLIRKLTTKTVSRAVLTMLRPRLAPWRYQRGSRSLAENLRPEDVERTSEMMNTSVAEDGEEEVPEEVGDVIDFLLRAVKDKDTVCRWSAAKGLGRIGARLPRIHADEIVSAMLDLFGEDFADASHHGACLALAELGRRGLLLPERLNQAVPLVVRSLTFDEQRGSYSVGSHVRDAACYVCWSFARAYDPQELQPFTLQLAGGLLTAAVFDREINCRRAASAAFQEHVGRQRGAFPHGIQLLTTLDYYAVGNRTYCYREASVFVAGFPEYTRPLIDHLLYIKCEHWDEEIRKLTAEALQKLSALDPDYVKSNVVPVLISYSLKSETFRRQGALLALGRICKAMGRGWLPDTTMNQILDIPQLIEKRLLHSLAGELLRVALNDFIGNMATIIEKPEADAHYDVWRLLLEENLCHQREDIRSQAQLAIKELFKCAVDQCQVDHYVRQAETATQERHRIGAALALAVLPTEVILQHWQPVVDTLVRFSIVDNQHRKPELFWTLARRHCLLALKDILVHIGLQRLPISILETVHRCFIIALDDYTSDSKGDIGAHVRESGIECLKETFLLLIKSPPDFLSIFVENGLAKVAQKKLLQQCCDRIKRTHLLACQSLETVVDAANGVEKLRQLGFANPEMMIKAVADLRANLDNPSSAMVSLLDDDEFLHPILLGFSSNIGGLSESGVKAWSDTLLTYLGKADAQKLRSILETVVMIFEEHSKIVRVTLPLLKTIDLMLSSNYLDDIPSQVDGALPLLERVLQLTVKETGNSKNPQNVLIGLAVCSRLMRYDGTELADKALRSVLKALVHPFPRVRRETAALLYETLMFYGCLDNHNEQVLAILSETDWNMPQKELSGSQELLMDLLKVS